MSKRPVLLIDGNYLCHRQFYVKGGLSHDDIPTGMAFGFLGDVVNLSKHFQSTELVFCFDHPDGNALMRKQIYPRYKADRKPRSWEERELKKEIRKQINRIRSDYLRELGYMNVFCVRGYEADDLLAQCAQSLGRVERVIVTADHDMYQCLTPDRKCRVFHPQQMKEVDWDVFIGTYGISPKRWATVKAIGGCSSDNIPGVRGVGEKTAIKYLCNKLNRKTVTHKKIETAFTNGTVNRNTKLTKLPIEGCPKLTLREDNATAAKWTRLCQRLGITSLDQPYRGRYGSKRSKEGQQV